MPKRPDRRRLRAIRDRLRKEYGRPRLRPHHAPVDELVLTVLSQNTNDRNRDVAYGRLRERSAPKYPRASGSKSAAEASAASTKAAGGPSSQAIGGEMMLYAGVW